MSFASSTSRAAGPNRFDTIFLARLRLVILIHQANSTLRSNKFSHSGISNEPT